MFVVNITILINRLGEHDTIVKPIYIDDPEYRDIIIKISTEKMFELLHVRAQDVNHSFHPESISSISEVFYIKSINKAQLEMFL